MTMSSRLALCSDGRSANARCYDRIDDWDGMDISIYNTPVVWMGFPILFVPIAILCRLSVAGQLDGNRCTRLLYLFTQPYYTPYTASIDTEALFFSLFQTKRDGVCVKTYYSVSPRACTRAETLVAQFHQHVHVHVRFLDRNEYRRARLGWLHVSARSQPVLSLIESSTPAGRHG